jgi:hypothetical protein
MEWGMRALPLLLVASACSSDLLIHHDVSSEADQRVTVSGAAGAVTLVAYDGREAPYQLPSAYDPDQPTLISRHMGVHFFDDAQIVGPGDALAATGVDGRLIGAAGTSSGFPTSVVQGADGALGMYIDTDQLHALSYFPFSQAYCQQVGLGSSHFILGQELQRTEVRPWSGGNGALSLSVDAELATSVVVGDGAPIFQISFFAYLTDTVNGSTLAILFNVYDPRGPYGRGIGNDHNTYFYTTSVDPSLSSDFTVVSGAHQHSPFGWQTFEIRIDADQLRSMLGQFPQTQPLSLNPADYRLGSIGMLNEMNFLYADAAQCIASYDPATSAKVGFGLRGFKVDVEAAQPSWHGALDGVSPDGLVRGWACQTGSASPVTVRLSAGGQTLADLVADEAGEDAIGAICGAGTAHRFSYQPTPAQLSAFAGQTVGGAVLGSGTPLQTFGGVNCALPAAQQQPPPVELDGNIEGVFMDADNNVWVQGWACVKGSPIPAVVSVAGLGDATADELSEPAVGSACDEATAGHRWSIHLTAAQVVALGGQTLSAQVRDAAGTKQQALPVEGSWPVDVPSFFGGFDGVGSDGVVRGWTCAIGRDAALQVTLRVDSGSVLTTVTAGDSAEGAVGTLCHGSSAHRFTVQLTQDQQQGFAGETVTAEVDVAGAAVYALPKFDGIVYSVP